MLRISFIILMFAIASISRSEDNIEPIQCNGPPPIRMNPDGCCRKPIFKADFRACMNKTRQIIMQRFHDRRGTSEGSDDECLANCFSENAIFTNDEINRDELVKVLETQTQDSAWIPIHSTAVDKCVAVLKPDLENIENAKWTQKCNRIAVRMILCLNVQYFANCPETHFQNDNANCKAFQEHIKTCPLPKGHPGHGPGRKGFGEKRGFRFDGPPHFGFNFGPESHFGSGSNFGPGPNFGTGQVFGFL